MKEVPDFKQLNEHDQVVIIRNAAIEVVKLQYLRDINFQIQLLNICDYYNCETSQIEIGQCSYPIHKLTSSGISSSSLDKIHTFIKSIRALQLREEEKALVRYKCSIIILFIFSKGPPDYLVFRR